MDIFLGIANTLLILGLFWYQHSLNKVLKNQISSQKELISETKGVVEQQSIAVESQKKVVDTAIQYSEAFNPEKLEKILRKEVEAEKDSEISTLKMEYEHSIEKTKTEHSEKAREVVTTVLEIAVEKITSMVTPLMQAYVTALLQMPKDQRDNLISQIEDAETRDNVRGVVFNIENSLTGILADALRDEPPN